MSDKKYTDLELEYAAQARCSVCQAGLAAPLNVTEALAIAAWTCSAGLRGEVNSNLHDALPYAFYKIREESNINNRAGLTTRPPGTVCKTKGEATCPKCGTWWESEPYVACGLNHHWFSGPCPTCGYAVGGAGTYDSRQGKPIETRFKTVVETVP